MNEIWKITTVNKDYEVSNLGNIRSNKRGVPRLLKPFPRGSRQKNADNKGWYLAVRLLSNGAEHDYPIHRLVALAFIPNPNNLPFVNHINGIKNDNRVENLEWCDASYNIWHSYNILGNTNGANIAVVQYTKEGEYVREYGSINEAYRITDIDSSAIAEVCRKDTVRKTAGGFIWRYKGDEDVAIEYAKTSSVVQISKYGEKIKTFSSVREAAKAANTSEGGISGICMKRARGYNYAGGFIWRYEEEYDEKEFGYFVDKTFVQMTRNNIFVAEYKGTHELVDKGGFELIKVIMCCRGKRNSTDGFKWCIKEEEVKTRESKREKPVIQLDKQMNFIAEYPSSVMASQKVNIPSSNIIRCCKVGTHTSAAGYRWMYKEDYNNLKEY
jgi:hypothetical protein